MRHRRERAHAVGLIGQLVGRVLGKGQALISAGDELPLVLALYPRGRAKLVDSLRDAVRSTFPQLPAATRSSYQDVLARATPVVIADLRRRNPCTCLGHHHLPGSHSGFARAFAADTGRPVGEIDLAIDAIRDWKPLPLSGLAVEAWVPECDRVSRTEFAEARFHAALLSVFLHELEHLAFPEHSEHQVRERSNRFYVDALRAQLSRDFGLEFGITAEATAA
jgi:hypothetical protein